MISEQRVMALFEEANPVPDIDKLGVVEVDATSYLATLDRRSSEMTLVSTKETDVTKRNQTRKMLRWSVAAAFIALVGIAFVLVNQTDEDPVAAGPASTIEAYKLAYNAADIDGVMALFTEESVMSAYDGTYTGLTAIRSWHVNDLEFAASEDAYTFSTIKVTGTAVTWDQTWTSSEGNEFCYAGQSAVVEDGVILSWTWSGSTPNC